MSNWSKDEPYNSLPDLPPKGFQVSEDLNRALIRARVALAKLDQAAKSMVSVDVLILGVSISEAQASSEIENIVTTQDALFESMATPLKKIDAATISALRYRATLAEAYQEVCKRPVTVPLISKLASNLMGHKMPVRFSRGTFIGGPTSRVVYTPPEGAELISKKLDALVSFLAQGDLDPLIRICLAHYQFEAIHPFSDGNGRTGRMLNVLAMVQLGLLEKPILAASFEINKTRSRYYKLLEEATSKGAYEDWVFYLLEVFVFSANRTLRQIEEIEALRITMGKIKSRVFPSGISAEIIHILLMQPYCRIGHFVANLGISRPTAAKYLEELEALGILRSLVRGREKYFVNTEILKILEN
jgi:Fic family protein